jgi:uncharacterized membrane protein YraQ (UPF0718 family)
MQTIIFYSVAIIAITLSFFFDKGKTQMALKKAWASFSFILPDLVGIMFLVGIILSVFNPELISKYLGKESGFFGMFIASIFGSITLIPGFVAFPLTATLLKNGADYPQLASFISTLMMVGVITLPVEMKFFSKKVAIIRNVCAYVFSFIVAFIIGSVL